MCNTGSVDIMGMLKATHLGGQKAFHENIDSPSSSSTQNILMVLVLSTPNSVAINNTDKPTNHEHRRCHRYPLGISGDGLIRYHFRYPARIQNNLTGLDLLSDCQYLLDCL